jgi:hypothetical protein
MNVGLVIALWALMNGLAFGQQSPPRELETGKPAKIIFPPPALIEAKVAKGRLSVRFRELGLERVVRYNLYVYSGKKWSLIGASEHSPIELESCKSQSAVYELAAVDESQVEGERRRFKSRLACTRAKPESPK